MSEAMDRRICEEARYIIRTGATVRACAAEFGVSKTTVHKDMRKRLGDRFPGLADEVGAVLDFNLKQRHIRGGLATKRKYDAQKQRTGNTEDGNAVGNRH